MFLISPYPISFHLISHPIPLHPTPPDIIFPVVNRGSDPQRKPQQPPKALLPRQSLSAVATHCGKGGCALSPTISTSSSCYFLCFHASSSSLPFSSLSSSFYFFFFISFFTYFFFLPIFIFFLFCLASLLNLTPVIRFLPPPPPSFPTPPLFSLRYPIRRSTQHNGYRCWWRHSGVRGSHPSPPWVSMAHSCTTVLASRHERHRPGFR